MADILRHAATVAFVLLILSCAVLVQAAVVETSIPVPEESASDSALREAALGRAFSKAVTDEARSMLPQNTPTNVQAALKDLMDRLAGKFVITYKVFGGMVREGMYTLRAEVVVNRPELRRYLSAMGVFRAASGGTEPLNLDVSGAGPDEMAQAGKLALLSGFQPGNQGLPAILLTREEKKGWRGSMKTGDLAETARAQTLDQVWFELVRTYTAGKGAETTAPIRGDVLVVSGWFTVDGARRFDNILNGWRDAVIEAVLTDISIAPEGVTGTWRVNPHDTALLRDRLGEYLGSRNLSHTFGSAQSDGNADQ